MDKPKFHELVNMVEQVHNGSIIRFTERFDKKVGISLIIVLSEIRKLGACQASELAKVLGYSKSSMSAIMKKLFAANYIEQKMDLHDRRKNVIIITDEGNAILDEAEVIGQEYYETMYSVLTEDELMQYIEIQKKLLHQVQSFKK